MSRDMNSFLWIVSSLSPSPFPAYFLHACLASYHLFSTRSMLVIVLGIEENKAKFCSHGACILVEVIHNEQMKEGEEGRKDIQMMQGGKWLSKGRVPSEGGGPDTLGSRCFTHLLPQPCAAPTCCSLTHRPACDFSPL